MNYCTNSIWVLLSLQVLHRVWLVHICFVFKEFLLSVVAIVFCQSTCIYNGLSLFFPLSLCSDPHLRLHTSLINSPSHTTVGLPPCLPLSLLLSSLLVLSFSLVFGLSAIHLPPSLFISPYHFVSFLSLFPSGRRNNGRDWADSSAYSTCKE